MTWARLCGIYQLEYVVVRIAHVYTWYEVVRILKLSSPNEAVDDTAIVMFSRHVFSVRAQKG